MRDMQIQNIQFFAHDVNLSFYIGGNIVNNVYRTSEARHSSLNRVSIMTCVNTSS